MRVLVYQVAIELKTSDGNNTPYSLDNFLLYKASSFHARKYADKIGADYLLINEERISVPSVGAKPIFHHACFQRLQVMSPEFRHYDYVIYLDSDVVPKGNSPNILDHFGVNEGNFFAVQEVTGYKDIYRNKFASYKKSSWIKDHAYLYQWYRENHKYFNSGVFVADKKARAIIWSCWEDKYVEAQNFWPYCESSECSGSEWWLNDQPLLNGIVHTSKSINFSPLAWNWNAFIPSIKKEYVDQSYFKHYCSRNGTSHFNEKVWANYDEDLKSKINEVELGWKENKKTS